VSPKSRVLRGEARALSSGLPSGVGPCLALLEEVDEDGGVLVTVAGSCATRAHVSSHLDPLEVRQAAARHAAALVLVGAAGGRPVLIGLIEERLRSVPPPALSPETRTQPSGPDIEQPIARVDGRSVAITGQYEVVLRCGKASITLQEDGTVVVRGTRVETDADGVNRIKGASVRIN
jgi:hypothetical protein